MRKLTRVLLYSLAIFGQIFLSSAEISRKLADDDWEITNEDARVDVLNISPLQITLSPTPEALRTEDVLQLKSILEETILNNLLQMGGSLGTISALTFDDIVDVTWFPSKRLLRNGRRMVDDTFSTPHTVMKIPGGQANSTFSVYYPTPSEQDLNNAILSILVGKASSSIESSGFNYKANTSVIPDTDGEVITPKKDNIAAPVSIGVIAAVLVVLGGAFYARRNGTAATIQQKYDIMMSNLRARKNGHVDDADLQVEVCADNIDNGPITGPSSPESVKSFRSILSILSGQRSPLSAKDANAVSEPTSPESVKSNKSFGGIISSLRKPRRDDDDDSVQVEVCTDNIRFGEQTSPQNFLSNSPEFNSSFTDEIESPSSVRSRESKKLKRKSLEDYTVEVNQD